MDDSPYQSSFVRQKWKNDDEECYKSRNLILWIATIALLIEALPTQCEPSNENPVDAV